jgi:hypothetical protein
VIPCDGCLCAGSDVYCLSDHEVPEATPADAGACPASKCRTIPAQCDDAPNCTCLSRLGCTKARCGEGDGGPVLYIYGCDISQYCY